MSRLKEALSAYQISILAKDLTGRFPNVNRTLMNVDRISEAMMSTEAKNSAADSILELIAGKLDLPVNDTPKIHTAPPVTIKSDNRKLDKKEFFEFKNQVFDRLDQLIKVKKTSEPVEVKTE